MVGSNAVEMRNGALPIRLSSQFGFVTRKADLGVLFNSAVCGRLIQPCLVKE